MKSSTYAWIFFGAAAAATAVAAGIYVADSGGGGGESTLAYLDYVPADVTLQQWPSVQGVTPMVVSGELVPFEKVFGVRGTAVAVAVDPSLQLGGFQPFTVAYLVNGAGSTFQVIGHYQLIFSQNRVELKSFHTDEVTGRVSEYREQLAQNVEVSGFYMTCFVYTGESLQVYIIQNGISTLVGVTQSITAIRETPPGASFAFSSGENNEAVIFAAFIRREVNLSGLSKAFEYVGGSATSDDSTSGGGNNQAAMFASIALGVVAMASLVAAIVLMQREKKKQS